MKGLLSVAIIAVVIITLVIIFANPTPLHNGVANTMNTLTLKSSAFEHNGEMPSQYTCDGENISPPLEISGAPEETESFALIVDDPDAPGGVWDHWLAWNIPEDTAVIEEGVAPPGKAGTNSFGKTSYGGPCPPSGTHRYFFKLYALDSKLDIHSESPKNVLEGAMKGHILEQAKLVGLYRRSN